jgi:HlyD family secretion protein
MALERTQRKAAADVVQAEAELTAKEAEHKRQREKLTKIKDQISKARIYAPAAGLVVHATTGRGHFWRGRQEPLSEGQQVREREELIHLPTAEAMMAQVRIHEADLTKVKPGLPVSVTVQALPGNDFTGAVQRIAPLPDATSVFLNPDLKVYDCEIDLRGDVDLLRTGMSCDAEIVVETFEDAVYVPMQAVTRLNGQDTVYVMTEGKARPRAVETGLDNNRMVRITKGLDKGEMVSLTPPLSASSRERRDDAEADAAAMGGARPDQSGSKPGAEHRASSGGRRGTGTGSKGGGPGTHGAAGQAKSGPQRSPTESKARRGSQ